ncbi:methyltransferase [Campylobacterota bacterium]|nr:methyltransferase [Campylobacterota bacterium]
MQLWQPNDGYRYNTDSILLYDFAARKRLRGSILDVGCGCGIVGLLLARDFNLSLTGVDIQEEMVRFAEKNSAQNGIKARFAACDFRGFDESFSESFNGGFNDGFSEGFNGGKKFDSIVSNPPFYSAKTTPSKNGSLRLARYADALSIDDFLRGAGRLLASDGDLFFCYDAAESSALISLMNSLKWHIKAIRFAHRDRASSARLMFIHAKKSSVKSCEILAPIFMRENGAISAEIAEIGKRAATQCAN